MFNRARHTLSTNYALSKLGINPRYVKADYRRGIQDISYIAGNSPKEAAIFIAANLPDRVAPETWQVVAHTWYLQGEVRKEFLDELATEFTQVVRFWDLM